MKNVIITGSIAFDYLMRFPGRFTDHIVPEKLQQVSLSFLVDRMAKHWGGVGANIAYSLGLLGLRPRLMGTVGRDFGDYRVWLQDAGVDCSLVRQIDDVFTASFFANTDLANNQIGSFYTGAMAYAKDYPLSEVVTTQPDLVVVSPNDPTAMLNYADECRANNWRFVADPSQQVPRLDGAQITRCIEGAHLLVVNTYEAEMIQTKTGRTQQDLRAMVDVLVITHGPRGSTVYVNGDTLNIPVFPTDEDGITDPSGAGDAYRAGLLRGHLAGLPLDLCARMGALCATYVLENVGTQNHHFTPQSFVERFRTVFDDADQLDALLPAQV